ncbi:unnamed protein product [Closterium sp. NIES-54]
MKEIKIQASAEKDASWTRIQTAESLLLQGRPAAAARLAERLLAQLLGKGRRENGEGLAWGGGDGEGNGDGGGEDEGMRAGRGGGKSRKRREKGEKKESIEKLSESGAAAAAAGAAAGAAAVEAAVEAVGMVWVQANARMGRHSQVLSEFKRLFGCLSHVPPPLFLIWLSLAVSAREFRTARTALEDLFTQLLTTTTTTGTTIINSTSTTNASSPSSTTSHTTASSPRASSRQSAWGKVARACAQVHVCTVLVQGLGDVSGARQWLVHTRMQQQQQQQNQGVVSDPPLFSPSDLDFLDQQLALTIRLFPTASHPAAASLHPTSGKPTQNAPASTAAAAATPSSAGIDTARAGAGSIMARSSPSGLAPVTDTASAPSHHHHHHHQHQQLQRPQGEKIATATAPKHNVSSTSSLSKPPPSSSLTSSTTHPTSRLPTWVLTLVSASHSASRQVLAVLAAWVRAAGQCGPETALIAAACFALILLIRFRAQASRGFSQARSATLQALRDLWSLAFTVNLSPLAVAAQPATGAGGGTPFR